jgi:hypothetical protein
VGLPSRAIPPASTWTSFRTSAVRLLQALPGGRLLLLQGRQGRRHGFLEYYLPHYWTVKGKGFACFQTANHDMKRLSKGGRDRDAIEAGFAFILSMPGVPTSTMATRSA